jgi:plastocyanin
MMFLSHRPGRAASAAAAAGLCVMALTGCSDDGNGSSSASPSATASIGPSPAPSSRGEAMITIQNFAFHPASMTVAPGTKITVVNKDTTTHTVTAGSTFNTGDVAAGKTATFTAPSAARAYAYNCTIHPFMKGSLTVR